MPIKQSIFKRYFEFDGKRYEIHAIRQKKANAEKIAESLRKKGFNARVKDYAFGQPPWAVYKRRAALG